MKGAATEHSGGEAQAIASVPSTVDTPSEMVPHRPRRSAAAAADAAISRFFAPASREPGWEHVGESRRARVRPAQASSRGVGGRNPHTPGSNSAKRTQPESRRERRKRQRSEKRMQTCLETSGAEAVLASKSGEPFGGAETEASCLYGGASDANSIPRPSVQEVSTATPVNSIQQALPPVQITDRRLATEGRGEPSTTSRPSSQPGEPGKPRGQVDEIAGALKGIAAALRGLETPEAAAGNAATKPVGSWGFFCMGWGQPPPGFSIPALQQPGFVGVTSPYPPEDGSAGVWGNPSSVVLPAERVPAPARGSVTVLPSSVRAPMRVSFVPSAVPASSVSAAAIPGSTLQGATVPLSWVASGPGTPVPAPVSTAVPASAACAPTRTTEPVASAEGSYFSLGPATLLTEPHDGAAGVNACGWNAECVVAARSPLNSSSRHGKRMTCEWSDRNVSSASKVVEDGLLRM
ncbi:hypothetical protein TGVAND_270050 [Toxoplasma gondii VAND]|uniref:Uncharacterized protein n=1 Tax=Toxoplasma gondii VAND TaxID=933077 RepID=A0A086Q069_TOXGO|nr:hypothetical protein TGVAND_270050 [Toxoplasma gondii VAND]